MNVLFVFSTDDVQSVQAPLRSWASIQFGISCISAVLKSRGHQTQLLVLGSNQGKANQALMQTAIEDFSPQIIGFTAVFSQYAFIRRVAGYMKKQWPGIFQIIGGPHATLMTDEVVSGPFDAVCVGEGEFPVVELCEQLERQDRPQGIANLWIKSSDGSLEKNPPREFLQDLDQLPFPDREMWKPWMKEQMNDEMSVMLGRGCPYSCPYCSNHALRQVAQGKYVRMRSPESIVQEVALLHEQFQYDRIYFEVETIACDKQWMLELCHRLAAFNQTIVRPTVYGCNYRLAPESLDETLFAAMEQARFHRLNIGLESGSERIRRDVLKRDYSNADFLKAVALARQHGLKINIFNLIGLPGETLADHQETIDLNRQCQPEKHATEIFFPYPGTELYRVCDQQGLLRKPLDTTRERTRPVMDLPGFSQAQQRSAYLWFSYHVYKGFKPLGEILLLVMMLALHAHPKANLWFRKIVQVPVLRYLRAWLFWWSQR